MVLMAFQAEQGVEHRVISDYAALPPEGGGDASDSQLFPNIFGYKKFGFSLHPSTRWYR
jgi:hypothetical protein